MAWPAMRPKISRTTFSGHNILGTEKPRNEVLRAENIGTGKWGDEIIGRDREIFWGPKIE